MQLLVRFVDSMALETIHGQPSAGSGQKAIAESAKGGAEGLWVADRVLVSDGTSYMAGMYNLDDLLNLAAQEGAEELRLEPGRPPVMLLRGKSRVMDGAVITSDDVARLFDGIATEEQRRELRSCGDIHFTFAGRNSTRFNVSAAMRGGNLNLRIKNLGR